MLIEIVDTESRWDSFFGLIIVANLLFIGIETDNRCDRKASRLCGRARRGGGAPAGRHRWDVLECVFLVIFCIEFCWRVSVLRQSVPASSRAPPTRKD